ECDTSATSYLFDGSPLVSFDGGRVVSAMFSQLIVGDSMLRPLSTPTVDVDAPYQHANTGLFTTQDSTLGLTVDYWTPTGNLAGVSGGTWKAVLGRAAYFNFSGAPLDSVFCAFGWDWDVPADSGARNSSAIESGATPTYIYQQGSEFGVDTGNSACRDNSTRYAATFFTPPVSAGEVDYTDAGSGEMGVGFQSLYTRDNSTFVGGNWESPLVDSMLRNNFGLNIFTSTAPDSQVTDLHTVLNGGAYRIDPDDTLYLWFRMMTGFGTQAEFEEAASATRALANPGACCSLAGNANGDTKVNIADVTFLIARIFAGGAAPPCCEQASANGDNKVNIADVTFLIARIFAGGAAPVCGPVGMGC
ncbi:MAG: dockerin type I repeat-containing protein, partial [Candidatus Zixiibacteriota bacterium]